MQGPIFRPRSSRHLVTGIRESKSISIFISKLPRDIVFHILRSYHRHENQISIQNSNPKAIVIFLITFHLAMPNTALIYYCGGFLKTQKEENYNFDQAHF